MRRWLVAWVAAGAAFGFAASADAESLLYSFLGGVDGAGPAGGLASSDGKTFYGTTQFHGALGCGGTEQGCGTIYSVTVAGTQNVLYRFAGPPDGYGPLGTLVIDGKGNLYGTTQYGGTGACSSSTFVGCGTVFELSPPKHRGDPWTEQVLYSFCSVTGCADGAFPEAGLVADSSGALYGTVNSGGDAQGHGLVFELKPPREPHAAWHYETIYLFCAQANCADGANPDARLAFDAAGNLYGTAIFGGANSQGVVFELAPPARPKGAWGYGVLYDFCSETSCADGQEPEAGVVIDQKGAVYGTATGGGSGFGLLYRLTPANGSWSYDVLHDFGGADGNFPKSDLTIDATGTLYGEASFGGTGSCDAGCGTVFELRPHRRGGLRRFQVLHHFQERDGGDGTRPLGNLVFDRAGRLLGTASAGGTDTFGAIYRLLPPSL
jgi:uncharacterized repeat protein (TIGR03803 family)